jgi:hypothetical protein
MFLNAIAPVGHRNMESKCESFVCTPYHAKALECMAKEHECRAELMRIPLVWNSSDRDPNEKKRKQLNDKMDKIRADWVDLEAKLLKWKAEECRKNDDTQKSMGIYVKGEPLRKSHDVDKGSPLYVGYDSRANFCLARKEYDDPSHPFSRIDSAIKMLKGVQRDPLEHALHLLKATE